MDKRKADKPVQLTVVGLLVSQEFQQSQYLVNKLHLHRPDKYRKPVVRPMFNVDWIEFLTKARRKYGHKALWNSKAPVAVFENDDYLGGNSVFIASIRELFVITLNEDFAEMGRKQVLEYFEKMHSLGRQFVYFQIKIDGIVVGSLLIMLYADLVPRTCEFFLNRCKQQVWIKTVLCRLVPGSWIQFRSSRQLEMKMPCENYSIPHDRRGVLSMTNFRRHTFNSTDFHISLAATAWMDHHYVAFGQVIQGEETLQILENLQTRNEIPIKRVSIETCGVYTTERIPIPELDVTRIKAHMDLTFLPDHDVDSSIEESKFRQGFYCLESDLRSYFPFLHLPDRLLAYLMQQETQREEADYEKNEEAVEEVLVEETEKVEEKRKVTIESVKEVRMGEFSFLEPVASAMISSSSLTAGNMVRRSIDFRARSVADVALLFPTDESECNIFVNKDL